MRSSSVGFRLEFDQQSVRTGERADTDFDVEDPDESVKMILVGSRCAETARDGD